MLSWAWCSSWILVDLARRGRVLAWHTADPRVSGYERRSGGFRHRRCRRSVADRLAFALFRRVVKHTRLNPARRFSHSRSRFRVSRTVRSAIGFDPVYPRETGFQPMIANRTVDRSEFRRLVGIRSLGRRLLAEVFAPWRGDSVSSASAARRGFRAPARTFAASPVGRRPSSDQLHGECTRRASVRLLAASSLLHGTCISAVKSVHRTPLKSPSRREK